MATTKSAASEPAKAVKATKVAKATGVNGKPAGLGKAATLALKALKSAGRSLTGTELAAKAGINPTSIGMVVGYRDPEINARPVHKGNLVNLGFVKMDNEEERGWTYEISAKGKAALAKAEAKAAK